MARVTTVLKQRGLDVNAQIAREIAALYEDGHRGVVPKDVPGSMTVNGEERTLSAVDAQRYEDAWSEAVRANLSALVGSEVFASADADSRALMIGKLYQYGAEYAKAAVFTDYEVSAWVGEVDAFADAGLGMVDYLEVTDSYKEIYGTDADSSMKGLEFARWIHGQRYTEKQCDVISESFSHNAGRYNDFLESGMSDRSAYDLTVALSGLEPIDGKTTVSAVQRYRAVIDADLTEDEQMAAFSVLMSESEYAKAEAGREFGISPGVYVVFKEQLMRYDVNGNGSYSQAEVEAALDAMGARGVVLPSNQPPTASTINMTNVQRAILWQIANKSWKPESNPYSVTVGRRVYEAINGK